MTGPIILGNLLPIPCQQFFDLNGLPLAGGSIYTYANDGVTPKATYQDSAQTILLTNPIQLNSSGYASGNSGTAVGIYGHGEFVFAVFDQFGVQQYTQPTADTTDSLDISSLGLNLIQQTTTADMQGILGITLSEVPVGSVIPFAGSSAPTGWHLCDGTAVSRTGNPNLFTAIGTSWGDGNGTTTFNLPDLQGRTVFGVDGGTGRLTSASIGTSAVLGVTAGDQLAQTDTITATVTDPSHLHYYDSFYDAGGTVGLGPAAGWSNISNSGTFGTRSATTGISVAVAGTNAGAQQNIPPMGVINWIIQLG